MSAVQGNLYSGRKLALIIGNDKYTKSYNELNHSIRNATDLRDSLKKIGFSVTLYTNVDDEMMKLIKDFRDQIGSGDVVLFYFSGHGCHADGKNYLIPVDDAKMETEKDLAQLSVSVEGIVERLVQERQSYATILILDCCILYRLKRTSISSPMVEDKSLREIQPSAGALIQFACTGNQEVTDTRNTDRNCVFTKHLLRHITRRNVDLTTILQDAAMDVYQESKQTQPILLTHGLLGYGKLFLNKFSKIIPNIPDGVRWSACATTVAGSSRVRHRSKRLYCPKGLFVNKYQFLYVADSFKHRIMKFTHDAIIPQKIVSKNRSACGPDYLCEPSDIIYDYQSKSFLISDYQNRRVLRWFQKNNTCAETIIEGSGYYGLAMDDEGFLYVSDTKRHEVRRYRSGDHDGIVVAGGNGSGSNVNQLHHPTYIFVGPDKALYVSDTWNDRVMKWNQGAEEGIIAAGGQGKGNNQGQLNHPTGLLVDQLGTIYVADYWNHRVMRWDRDATHGKKIAGRSLVPGYKQDQLNGPEGIAFDRYGNLYVADSNNHRVQRFLIKGD